MTFHAYHAHPAGGERFHARVITKVGNVDPGLDGRFQQHLARLEAAIEWSTYATLLEQWMGLDANPILGGTYEQFDFIK